MKRKEHFSNKYTGENDMEFKNRWKDNTLTYEKPDQEYVTSIMKQVEQVVSTFCDVYELDISRIKVNIASLEDVIIRTDMRVLYFSVFHNHMSPNEYKRITGLFIFWLLKRHPFWIDIKDGDDDDLIHLSSVVNEKIALHIAMTLLQEYNSNFFNYGEDLIKGYTRELEYSFTYRDLSKESLFLMFDPFYFEHLFSASFKDGFVSF